MIIRKEKKEDYNKIKELVYNSFKMAKHSDGKEHILVEKLRSGYSYINELSLVAEIDGNIVGYIMFTKAYVDKYEVLVLAPLAVSEDFQKKGIGSKLVIKAHKIAKDLGYKYSFVLGDPLYYSKFNYIKACNIGVIAPFEVPCENFMVCCLGNNEGIKGVLKYAKEFGI